MSMLCVITFNCNMTLNRSRKYPQIDVSGASRIACAYEDVCMVLYTCKCV